MKKWHQTNDKWNGKTWSEKGFWNELTTPLAIAQELVEKGGSELAVKNATASLQAAIDNLIPTSRVNATALYETLNTKWCWQGEDHMLSTAGDPVSADNCTFLSWQPYAKALTDGQALLEQLYENGTPTDDNTAAKQEAVDKLAAAADVHKLVNKEAYAAAYDKYMAAKPEAEALLQQYDPAKLEESDYTADSWTAYTNAHAVLKTDMAYVAINLSFACSLRIGEIVGLTWDNIHISDADIANDNAYLCVEKELARVKESSLAILGEEEIIKKFPRTMYLENASTVIVLKTPKTESSVRKVWMPKTVAYILREWKASQDKQKEFLGDEYLDYNLVVALPNGRPCEETVISNAFRRLKRDAKLPNVVFHSLRHSSTTYKLKLNHGDIKATQGDTGHSQADMVTKVYAHILDEDRKVNAQKFESAFYANPDLRSVKAHDEPQPALDVQSIIVQLQQSPELLSALTSLISNQGCK